MLARNSKLMNKKLIQYLLPSMFMIFAMQFGSLVDGIFVGNFIGNDALSASSLVLPILYIIQLPGFAIGTGGAIVVANYLGKRNVSKSKTTFSLCLIIGMAFSLLFAGLAYLTAEPLAKLFCPNDIVEYARQYILIYMLTDPIITLALLLGSFIGADNNPRLASAMYIVANIFKIGSEYAFIKWCGMGMYGAALSTGFGYFVGILLVFFYIKSKKRMLALTFKFDSSKECLIDSLKASSSLALNMFLTAIQMSICSIYVSKVIEDNFEIMIFGILANMVFVFDLFSGGIIQTIPNICGVLYGERDYYALRKIAKKIFIINLAVTVFLTALIAIFPGVYCTVFGFSEYTSNSGLTFTCIWIYLASFIPYEISKYNQMYYPTITKNVPAYVTVLCRELILVIPLTLGLLFSYGLKGYCVSQASTELGTVFITYIFIYFYNKKKKTTSEGLLMIPNIETQDKYDVTITNDINEVEELSMEVKEYALKHGANKRDATMISIGAEEMVANIIQYGYRFKNHRYYIDVTLRISNDKMLLSIRDDGIIFDPTQYKEDEHEFSTSGILLVRKVISNMSYTRVLNTNNTYLEINLQGA